MPADGRWLGEMGWDGTDQTKAWIRAEDVHIMGMGGGDGANSTVIIIEKYSTLNE